MTVDVEPTALVIDRMIAEMYHTAKELDRLSKNMRERNDISYASEAIQAVVNMIPNLRLDLLVTRPIRELSKETP